MIKFNEVTSCSKILAAIVLLGIFPALTFYIGIQYARTQQVVESVPVYSQNGLGKIKSHNDIPSLDGSVCYQNEKYFVVTKVHTDTVGSDIIVKEKENPDQIIPCMSTTTENDFVVGRMGSTKLNTQETEAETKARQEALGGDEDADYFLTLTSHFLILDRGTAPDPRTLVVYDLTTNKKVYIDSYAKPFAVNGSIVTYWSPLEGDVTTENCSDKSTFTLQGLSAVREGYVSLDLATLMKKSTGETRCVASQ